MKKAQLVVAGLAVVAGIGAFMLSGSKPKTVVVQAPVEVKGPATTDILVATSAVTIGGSLNEKNITWKPWPNDSLTKFHIRKSDTPKGIEDYKGAISRFPLTVGEPINSARIAKGEKGGVMAALLPQGMRAVATPISPENSVAGFILPNDRVDIILTRREKAVANGRDNFISETILSNIRILAIDQTVQEKDGEKSVLGRTATLELSPAQAEQMAMARQLGDLSLVLRPLVDAANSVASTAASELQQGGGSMTIIRFGNSSQVPVNR